MDPSNDSYGCSSNCEKKQLRFHLDICITLMMRCSAESASIVPEFKINYPLDQFLISHSGARRNTYPAESSRYPQISFSCSDCTITTDKKVRFLDYLFAIDDAIFYALFSYHTQQKIS